MGILVGWEVVVVVVTGEEEVPLLDTAKASTDRVQVVVAMMIPQTMIRLVDNRDNVLARRQRQQNQQHLLQW